MIIYLKELGFTVDVTDNEYHMDFKCYESCEEGVYVAIEGEGYCETTIIGKARLYLSGHVKWDGCSNWNFDANEDCMLHFCEREQLVNIGKLLAWMYDYTEKNLEKFTMIEKPPTRWLST